MTHYQPQRVPGVALSVALEADGEEEDFSLDDSGLDTETQAAPEDTADTATEAEDGGDSPDEDEDPPKDEPTKLADLKGMAVDKLAKLNQRAQDRADRKAVKDNLESIGQAKEDLLVLNGAMEGIRQIQKGTGFDRGVELDRIRTLARKYGLQGTNTALEGLRIGTTSEVALEGFKDVFKAIVDRILKAIKAVYVFVKQLFKHYFNDAQLARNANEKVFARLVDLNKDHGKFILQCLNDGTADAQAYVQGNLAAKRWLSHKGRFFDKCLVEQRRLDGAAGGMTEVGPQSMVARTTELLALFKFFGEAESMAFFKEIDLLATTPGNWTVSEGTVKGVDPSKLVADDSYRVSSIDGYLCPAHKRLYVREGYLGDVFLMNEFGDTRNPQDTLSCLEFLGTWTLGLRSDPSEVMDDKMPRLPMDALTSVNAEFLKLSDQLLSTRVTCEEFEWQADKIKKTVEILKKSVEDIDSTSSYADIVRHRSCTAVLYAANSWIKNGMTALDSGLRYGQALHFAWVRYLSMVLQRDLTLCKARTTGIVK